ncbi:MarR family winged helix-turn-helix transcriptional regulator [Rhodopseudomonas sp. B29]|uniref:MarR family winged helix-turn-helix transcriptional regulator n=1 Tax=Rhodopseudomonas sp. B29 TaxID=95607 RepID=UPI001FCB6EB7|nr:MarR family transcriptional regulator [Rhodopseudomonas sp. B29]
MSPSLRLSDWLPYRLFLITAAIARPLEDFYRETFSLNQAGWRILAVIAERDGANAAEIGRAAALDPFAVSRGIAQLVERGFATRRPGRADRRTASVAITPRGREAFDRIAVVGAAIETSLLSVLSDAERASLDPALRKLAAESARIDSAGWRELVSGSDK